MNGYDDLDSGTEFDWYSQPTEDTATLTATGDGPDTQDSSDAEDFNNFCQVDNNLIRQMGLTYQGKDWRGYKYWLDEDQHVYYVKDLCRSGGNSGGSGSGGDTYDNDYYTHNFVNPIAQSKNVTDTSPVTGEGNGANTGDCGCHGSGTTGSGTGGGGGGGSDGSGGGGGGGGGTGGGGSAGESATSPTGAGVTDASGITDSSPVTGRPREQINQLQPAPLQPLPVPPPAPANIPTIPNIRTPRNVVRQPKPIIESAEVVAPRNLKSDPFNPLSPTIDVARIDNLRVEPQPIMPGLPPLPEIPSGDPRIKTDIHPVDQLRRQPQIIPPIPILPVPPVTIPKQKNAIPAIPPIPTIDQLKIKPKPRLIKVDDCDKILSYAHLAANSYLPTDPASADARKLTDGWRESRLNAIGAIKDFKRENPGTGFSSTIYERVDSNGNVVEYAYVTRGTSCDNTYDCIKDWENNIAQSLAGVSAQYDQSAANATILDAFFRDVIKKPLMFIGHSLGGGMASLNAFITHRPAVTFNAAGLNYLTKQKWGVPAFTNGPINAYVVDGELVNFISPYPLQAEGRWHTLHSPRPYAQNPSLYQHMLLHYMDAVIEAIKNDCKNGNFVHYETADE